MSTDRYLPFVGRILIGLTFTFFGLGKAIDCGKTVAMITAVGLPFPSLAFLAAVSLEIVGGLLLIVGYKVQPVPLLLAVFSIVTASYFHCNIADENTLVHFFKNVIIAGGLFQIAGFGAGAFSIDQRASRGSGNFAGLSTAR